MTNAEYRQKIREDNRVAGISDERGRGDGIWVYLTSGYVWAGQYSSIHEQTWRACYRELRKSVQPAA